MLKPGDRVDRYRIEEPIGEGGMGRVFRALDERLERRVALKVLHDRGEGEESRGRLVREAKATAKLDHPNIVSVYDVGEHDDAPFIVMELVEGRSLRSLISDATTTPGDRVRILAEVARGLAVAHDAGIVHRDVKPENVLVRKDGRVKVVDFGIARRTRTNTDPSSPTTDAALSTLTADGVKVGTPTYMAPEQIKGGDLDGRVDQFAWGVTAYEVFVGRPPWSGDAMSLIAAILTEDPAAPPSSAQMPPAFAAVVRRSLAKKSEDRYATMHELIADLETAGVPSLLGSIPSPVLPSSPMPGSPYQPAASSRPPPYSGPPQYRRSRPALSRRYSPKELTDILDRAVGAQPRRYGHDELAEAAREVGAEERTLQEAMQELFRRGSVAPSEQAKEVDVLRVKRLLAIWGVLSAFFFFIDVFSGWGPWFQYVVASLGVPFGLLIVRILFRAPSPKRSFRQGDYALEHDVASLTRYLRERSDPARVRVATPQEHRVASPAPPQARPQGETMRQAEAEVEAFLASSPEAADRARQK